MFLHKIHLKVLSIYISYKTIQVKIANSLEIDWIGADIFYQPRFFIVNSLNIFKKCGKIKKKQ